MRLSNGLVAPTLTSFLAALIIALFGVEAFIGVLVAQNQSQNFEYATRIRPHDLDDTKLAKALDMAKAAGITMLDVEVDWGQTDQGDSSGDKRTYDWSEVDRVLEGTEVRDMKVSLLLTHTPDWVHPDLSQTEGDKDARVWTAPKGDVELQHWSNFIRDVVERYKGRVAHYEIWNEPNHPVFWRPEPNLAEYATLLRAAYLAAKETDPQATVMFGGLSQNDLGYLNEYYQVLKTSYPDAASNKYFFDVLDVHPYSANRSPDLYTPFVNGQGKYGEVDANFLGFTRMKKLMEDQDDSGKKVFLGEYGFSTTDTWMKAVPDARRALYLKQAYELAREMPYVEGLSWYTYHPSSDDINSEWAIVDKDFNPSLTYRAYAQVTGAKGLRPPKRIPINALESISSMYYTKP